MHMYTFEVVGKNLASQSFGLVLLAAVGFYHSMLNYDIFCWLCKEDSLIRILKCKIED